MGFRYSTDFHFLQQSSLLSGAPAFFSSWIIHVTISVLPPLYDDSSQQLLLSCIFYQSFIPNDFLLLPWTSLVKRLEQPRTGFLFLNQNLVWSSIMTAAMCPTWRETYKEGTVCLCFQCTFPVPVFCGTRLGPGMCPIHPQGNQEELRNFWWIQQVNILIECFVAAYPACWTLRHEAIHLFQYAIPSWCFVHTQTGRLWVWDVTWNRWTIPYPRHLCCLVLPLLSKGRDKPGKTVTWQNDS